MLLLSWWSSAAFLLVSWWTAGVVLVVSWWSPGALLVVSSWSSGVAVVTCWSPGCLQFVCWWSLDPGGIISGKRQMATIVTSFDFLVLMTWSFTVWGRWHSEKEGHRAPYVLSGLLKLHGPMTPKATPKPRSWV